MYLGLFDPARLGVHTFIDCSFVRFLGDSEWIRIGCQLTAYCCTPQNSETQGGIAGIIVNPAV
jgi:hypothetical protein